MGKNFNQDDVMLIRQSEPFMIGNERCIIVKRIQFKKDKEYIDVRQYYQSKDSDEWLPTAKGIWIPVDDVDDHELAMHIGEKIIEFSKKD